MTNKNLSKTPFSEYEALLNIADHIQGNENVSNELRAKIAEIKRDLDEKLEAYSEARASENNYESDRYTNVNSFVENPSHFEEIRTRVHNTKQQVIDTFQELSKFLQGPA